MFLILRARNREAGLVRLASGGEGEVELPIGFTLTGKATASTSATTV